MSENTFLDVPLPPRVLGMPVMVMPRTSTLIVVAKSGDEARNVNWQNPLRRVQLPEAVADMADFNEAMKHWLIMQGPANTFPFTDPFDFASVDLDEVNQGGDPNGEALPMIAMGDQYLATTDGLHYTYQLQKAYELGGFSYVRPIDLPQVASVLIGMQPGGTGPILAPGAVPSMTWGGPYTASAATRPGGQFTIAPIPVANIKVYAGFYFDMQVRWESDDSFDAIGHSLETAGAAAINLVEVRNC